MKVRLMTNYASEFGAGTAGRIISLPNKQAIDLIKNGHAIAIRTPKVETVDSKQLEKETVEYPNHVGGGFYELPDGSRVRGRDKAIEAMDTLEKDEDKEDE